MSTKSQLSQIDHVVVLMLENRSFDHMLGFLYADQNNKSPLGHPFEGLTGKESNPGEKGKKVKVFKIDADDENAYFMPGADPGEGYFNTNEQLFSNHIVSKSPGKPANQGFVKNFAYTLGWQEKSGKWSVLPGTKSENIMGMFTPDMLPVLSGLAKGYAVCDHWFCSAPTETLPNRAFAAMGTSQGRLKDSPAAPYTAPTIFNSLGKANHSWSLYGYDKPPLSRGSYADITHKSDNHFGKFADFKQAVKNGTLANYVFLEPAWGKGGNSQHPNYDVAKGESFIKEVYDTLKTSKLWSKTLLIITYDEHGGCYDHVAPPENATPPDNTIGQDDFDFTRFGVRVPTVLISPLIEAGTVYRVPKGSMALDHTSILKTLEKRFKLQPLTKRDAAAPDFGDVLTLKKARTDDPIASVKPPVSKKSAKLGKKPDHLQHLYADSMKNLPLEELSRKPDEEERHFKTSDEAIKYGADRYRDYFKRYWKSKK
jgi:phospholipase C